MPPEPFSPYAPDAPWPTMRGDVRNAGTMRLPVCGPPAQARRWTVGGAIFSTPVIGPGERVFVGSSDGTFLALDARTGEEVWRFAAQGVVDSAACLGPDGTVYVPSGDGRVYALGPDGKEKWRYDLVVERRRFTASTIYWWEGNVALGPDGHLYGGNDDFRLHSLTTDGVLRWASLTGLQIWGAPAFDAAGRVFVSSFDMHLHAFDTKTGRTLWRRFLGDFLASSPAVDPEGRVFVGAFDGAIHAVDGATGQPLWKTPTRGHVYASAAITPDGGVCIGGIDGMIRLLDRSTGEQRWIFPAGAPVRASASVGPDPEGRDAYLLYIGDSDGVIRALSPDGACRWALSADGGASKGRACFSGVNASVALGVSGFCVPTAGGEIFFLPYDAGLRGELPEGLARGAPQHDAFVPLTPSGIPRDDDPVALRPGEILSVRCLGADTVASAEASAAGWPVHALVSPDRSVVHLVPQSIDAPGSTEAMLRVTTTSGAVRAWTRTIQVTGGVGKGDWTGSVRIDEIAVHAPAIVATFDQIGLASLSMDLRIIRRDSATGNIAAWGVQRFGMDADGHALGVPVPRRLLFAFQGIERDGALLLQSARCHFEITAFPVPLSRLRLTMRRGNKGPEGVSFLAEADREDVLGESRRWWARVLWPRPGSLARAPVRLLREGRRALGLVRSWFPRRILPRDFVDLCIAVSRCTRMVWTFLRRKSWRTWGLLDDRLAFCGAGTFRAVDLPALAPAPIRLESLDFDAARRRVVARFSGGTEPLRRAIVPGIALLDRETLVPLPIPYSTHTAEEIDPATRLPRIVTLDIPGDVHVEGRALVAVALLDLEPCGEIVIDAVKLPPWTFSSELRWMLGMRR